MTVSPEIRSAIDDACARVAPLWPLRSFVAVNPFLGFTDRPFEEACAAMRRTARADMLPGGTTEPPADAAPVIATVADVLDGLAGGDRQASLTAFMTDEVSRWCAAYFDEGQAVWRAPSRRLGLYAGWKAAMVYDRNAEAMGVRGFRRTVAAAPDVPVAAIAHVVDALSIPDGATADYLFRALYDVRGWAAYARHIVWTRGLHGEADDTLVQLLAVRVVWGYALFSAQESAAFRTAWQAAMARAASELATRAEPAADASVAAGLARLDAAERAYRRPLLASLARPVAPPVGRPTFQAAFCIDVRSEPYRRALEAACPGMETLGFAGFFGFPIEYVPIGQARGGAQCPVLLKPRFVVREGVRGAAPEEETVILWRRRLRRRAFRAYKAFKLSAISSFSFVETMGLLFGPKLVGDTLGLTRPVSHPRVDGLEPTVVRRLVPHVAPEMRDGRRTGFAPEERVDMAEAVLRAMSLTRRFARLVLLAGHGSTSVNNPHAAGLDCGACGGHTGEANARVAAAVLNDASVRAGLRARGIAVPDDTWFVPALHDTTTDAVRLFDTEDAPATHADDIVTLRAALARASARAREERAGRLGIPPEADAHRALDARSRDWSQVRPEWGLAGCAAFIAAPRALTRGLDLGGRAFLHDYDWREDPGFATLALIMTAPMVVATWIALQYYGSTVNNAAFGAGDKALHNVVGTVGVLEGNAGDLKAGLPLQSVHDGERFVHEPLRLTVLIDAPADAIDAVLAQHAPVRALVENAWIHLFARDADGTIRQRLRAGGWAETDAGSVTGPARSAPDARPAAALAATGTAAAPP
jgi:uncharacterized protein YbcC (UPF0753/DUF2309 family)